MGDLTGLYYPYARCLDEETLKRAILIYDKIIFIDPMSEKVKQGRYSVENHQQYLPDQAAKKLTEEWEYIKSHYDTLTKENIISFYDPNKLLNNPTIDHLITRHLQDDMGDQGVFRLFENSKAKTWSILRSRIPKRSFQYLHQRVAVPAWHRAHYRWRHGHIVINWA